MNEEMVKIIITDQQTNNHCSEGCQAEGSCRC